MIDASCGGTFMLKSEHEAWQLFENLNENSLHHASSSRQAPPNSQRKGTIYEIGHSIELAEKVDALSRKMDQLMSAGHLAHPSQAQVCALCSSPAHPVHECPSAPQFPEFVQEHINAAQAQPRPGNDPYSNTYNPGWRNHPNFSWKQQAPSTSYSQTFQPPQNIYSYHPPTHYPQFQHTPPPPPQRNTAFEEKVLTALQGLEANTQLLHSHTQSIAKLETQMGQLANALNKREEGKLPNQPVSNPRGQYMAQETHPTHIHHEQVNAMTTLRSGRIVDNKVGENNNTKSEEEDKIASKENPNPPSSSSSSSSPSSATPYVPKAPFPQCLNAPSPFGKKETSLEDMMEVFKQVKINLPLLDAIKQVPSYAKFLKDLCTRKRKSRTHVPKKVFLTEQVSSILQYNTPPKFKDPGAPTISCVIGENSIDQALLDLGASVNLLPYSVYEKFGLGELKPTSVSLQLADRSVKIPRGIVEDVLVKVDKFYFPVDFIILDMEHVPNLKK